MEEVEEDSQQNNSKSSFWHHIFNFKVAVSASLVWLGLICQDFYVYAMHMSWISRWYLASDAAYIVKWLATLIIVYLLFLFINYLIKKTVFKPLYHKKIAYIVLVVWLVMNLSCYQLLYFDYIPELKVYIFKLLHLIALYALVLTITRLIQKFRDKQIKHQLIIAIVLCIIGWVFLLLAYPGTWSLDDIHIVNNAAFYNTTPWQHFFSGMFQILCLQTIPFVFSVPLIQVLFNALMYSYCVVTLAKIFTKTPRQKLILEIILSVFFIFPPVLFYMLSGFRMGIYQFLELYLLTKLLAIFYDKTHKLTTLKLIEVTFFTIIVGSWRSECFFFPFILLIFLLLLGKERIKRTTAFIMAGISLVSVMYIGMINDKLIGNHDYTLINTIAPVYEIIKENDIDPVMLKICEEIIDLNLIESNPDVLYSPNGCIRKNYTEYEYKEYLITVIILIQKYPETFLKNRYNNIIKFIFDTNQNKIYPYGYAIRNFTKNYDGVNWFNSLNDSFLYSPINLELRNNVIAALSGIKEYNINDINSSVEFNVLHYCFYKFIIPVILFTLSLLLILIRRKWYLILPNLIILLQFIIIFFTAPTANFFYYLPIYIFLYVFSISVIFNNLSSLFSFLTKKLHRKFKD